MINKKNKDFSTAFTIANEFDTDKFKIKNEFSSNSSRNIENYQGKFIKFIL